LRRVLAAARKTRGLNGTEPAVNAVVLLGGVSDKPIA